jgi:PAS domain S-box-containing protein
MNFILPFIHFGCATVYLLLALYVLFKSSRENLNRVTAFTLFLFSLWSLSVTFFFTPDVPAKYLTFFTHLSFIANMAMGGFVLWSILLFCEKEKVHSAKWFRVFIIASTLFIVAIQLLNPIMRLGEPIESLNTFTFEFREGIESILIHSYYYATSVLSMFIAYRFHLRVKNRDKSIQVGLLLSGGLLSFLLGLTNYLLMLNNPESIPHLSNVTLLFLAAAILIGILKHGLFELTPQHVANEVYEIIPDALLLADMNGGIKRANSSFKKLTGYKGSELTGKSIGEYFFSIHNTPITNKDFLTHDSGLVEGKLCSKKGMLIPVLIASSRLKGRTSANIGLVILATDISEMKEHEKQLRQLNQSLELKVQERTQELLDVNNQLKDKIIEKKRTLIELEYAKKKAVEADRLKTAFLANMSHEIRTPMNGILGFCDLMRYEDLENDKRDEYLDIIEARGNYLLHLINDIIDISKIESKQLIIKQKAYNINFIIEQITQFFNQSSKFTENENIIEFSSMLSEDSEWVLADSTRLEQILINLINNANKFTHKGHIKVSCERRNNELVFHVEDNGIGVPYEKQKVIFERFRQSEETTSRVYGGAGLGLSISRGLVELMGGKIWLKSTPKAGSIFSFSIPYLKADEKQRLIAVH